MLLRQPLPVWLDASAIGGAKLLADSSEPMRRARRTVPERAALSPLRGPKHAAFVLQPDTRQAAPHGLADQPPQEFGCGLNWQPLGPDVGDAVALGIGPARAGAEDEVGPKSVGRPETWALTQEESGQSVL